MAVYSVLFFQGTFGGGGVVTAFTVPAGYVYVVRDLDAVSPASSTSIVMSELVANQNFAVVPAGPVTDQAVQPYTWRGRQVFESGQQLGLAALFDLVFARVSGYALTA